MQGAGVANDVEHAVALLNDVVGEIDGIKEKNVEDKESLELVRNYADQIWRSYIQKIPIS